MPPAVGLAALAALLSGCAEPVESQRSLSREGRFGIFRDLVLFPRSERSGGPFFLDRFESTYEDVEEWFEATGRPVPPRIVGLWRGRRPAADERYLPMSRLDLADAQEFARWRFGRLPRVDEWRWAATGGGRYQFPWGHQPRTTWANTGALGLGTRTPVGTFESGRRAGGPYDLVGNVAEWTASVPSWWSLPDEATEAVARRRAEDRLLAGPAAALWRMPGQPLPRFAVLAAASAEVPRLAVGWSFLSAPPFTGPIDWNAEEARWERLPRTRGDVLGVRVAVDPRGVLLALLEHGGRPDPDDRLRLARFLELPEHREVLAAAWPGAFAEWRRRVERRRLAAVPAGAGTEDAAVPAAMPEEGSAGELLLMEFGL